MIRFGIVGACGRGGSFRRVFDLLPDVAIHAVCDVNGEEIEEAKDVLGAREAWLDYEAMLDGSKLDAVLLGTPMPLHVPQAIAALERGIHVLSEVPAGVSIEECEALTRACRRSDALYMMAENYGYSRQNTIVRQVARQGLFGTPYYAEGEYLHELKALNEVTRWRRHWQTGINGVTYGTHSLGPILQWLEGDRVVAVSCAGTGHHYTDPRGDAYENEETCLMLCRLASGGLVRIRVDMLSSRPHAMSNYTLQGTEGCYESARALGERDRIWLQSRCDDANQWLDLEDLADEFLPASWLELEARAKEAGHGGGDLYEVAAFRDAIVPGNTSPAGGYIGIDQAMDYTLPGLISQQSIQQGGIWLDVPDSRDWT